MAVNPKKPYSRKEMYLAKAAGKGTVIPEEPWNREEAYLDDIAGRIDGIEEDVSNLNDKVTAMVTDFSYKGSVDTEEDLPENPTAGDVYTISDTGNMFVWDGDSWQLLNMSGVDVVQTWGDSETAIMSQGAVSKGVFRTNDSGGIDKTAIQLIGAGDLEWHSGNNLAIGDIYNPNNQTQTFGQGHLIIGGAKPSANATESGSSITVIGMRTDPSNEVGFGQDSVSIGYDAEATGSGATAIGYSAKAQLTSSVAIGYHAEGKHTGTIVISSAASESARTSATASGAIAIGGGSALTSSEATLASGAESIAIGNGARVVGTAAIAIGFRARSVTSGNSQCAIAIGVSASAGRMSIASGYNAIAEHDGGVALGAYSRTSNAGEVNVGSTVVDYGYNNSAYRLITGVYDGQSDHDACTVGQLNAATTVMTDDEFNTLWEEA